MGIQSIDTLVPDIYAPALGQASWHQVVDGIRASASAHAAILSLVGPDDGVCERVSRGLDDARLDHHLDVNPATVRWHLERVYARNGTAGQAELVALIQTLAHAAG